MIGSLESSFEVHGRRDASGTTSGPLRWVRGTVVGLTATSLALLGHSLAAGMSLQLSHLAWVGAVAVPVGIALSGRRWTLPPLLTVLLGAQLAFHLAFAGMSHGVAQHAISGSMPLHGEVMSTAGGQVSHVGHGSMTMVLSHLVAALLTALLLRRGEDWCWTLVRLLTRPWRLMLDVGRPLAATRLRHGVPLVAHAHDLMLLSGSQPRRGPPAIAF